MVELAERNEGRMSCRQADGDERSLWFSDSTRILCPKWKDRGLSPPGAGDRKGVHLYV